MVSLMDAFALNLRDSILRDAPRLSGEETC